MYVVWIRLFAALSKKKIKMNKIMITPPKQKTRAYTLPRTGNKKY